MTKFNIDQARNLLIGDGTTPLKLEYFPMEGLAERVRIALAVADIPFDDVRIGYDEWSEKKSTTRHGQLPEMTLPNGVVVTESMAMLRLAGEADPEGKLYPSEMAARVKVEGVLGLVEDMARAWRPSLFVFHRPELLGHPPSDEWDNDLKVATVKKVRGNFVETGLPRFMEYFTNYIKESGCKYLAGEDLTIADISAYQQISYFKKGVADYVPKECMDPFTEVNKWMERVISHPKIAAYKASKAK
ncbi:hypothetical protein ACHAXS_007779 [Conticribra weissflogii]